MSSGGYRKVTVGRHWNRPKPKIYECNYRDQERAYQDSYKDYSSTKQYLKENASDWAEKDAAIRNELDNIQKYGVRRGGSVTPRRYCSTPVESPITLRRANSTLAAQEANAEGSYLKSRLEASKERSYLQERAERAAKASEEESSYSSISTRATSLPKKVATTYEVSQDEEMANIERRLQKLRKLREELGLPSEVGSNSTSSESTRSARGKEVRTSSARSSSITRNVESALDDLSTSKKSTRSSAISSSTSNSTQMTNGRSSLSREINEDIKPSRKSARAAAAAAASSSSSSSSKMTNGRSSLSREDIDSKYSSAEPSPRLSKRRSDEFQSKKTSVKSSSTKVSSTKIIDDVENYDDDMLLPDIRKKLPTSQEILDKIKDMDL